MPRSICLILLFAFTTHYAYSQEQPPVTFPKGKKVCDQTPYKLVFDDEFNGTAIDYSKWRTWGSFIGGKEDDNWGQGRWDWAGHGIMRDENVIVKDGIAKLQIWHGPQYWHCTDIQNPENCPTHRENYSNAWLTTRYSQYFNSGRFQIRLKFPRSDHTWNTIWLYNGNGINEIDIAESHGGPFFPYGPFGHTNNFNVSYSLHAQVPPAHRPANPYKLRDDEIANHYPHQRWWDKFMGRYFDLDNWHTYTCEWDTALIATYLDGALVNQVPKYYYMECLPRYRSAFIFTWKAACLNVYHPALCTTDPEKTYHITRGFPYNNDSRCNLRITTGMAEDETPQDPFSLQYTDTSVYLKSEMAVDYVRVWQRHPEDDNHTTICGIPIPSIEGPSNVCSTASYSVDPSLTGSWSVTGLSIISQSNSSITVQPAPNTAGSGSIAFHYTPPGCISDSVTRPVDIGPPGTLFHANVVRTTFFSSGYGQNNRSNFSCAYNLFASNILPNAPVSPTTYFWDVQYGPDYANHFSGEGAYLTTPVSHFSSSAYGGIKGTLTITNACGTNQINISKSNDQQKIANDEPDFDSVARVNYYSAHISDTTEFKEKVEGLIQHRFIPDTIAYNEVALVQLMQEAITEALGNYVTPPGSSRSKAAPPAESSTESASTIFPNPTTNSITIVPGPTFSKSAPIRLTVTDIYGRKCLSYTITNRERESPTLSLESLPKGIYSILLTQNTHVVRSRILKQ